MVELGAACGETVHLGRLSAGRVVYVDKVDCDKSVRLVSRIGSTVPLHCSAMGKAILARMEPADREPHIAAATGRRTEHTLLGDALREEIAVAAGEGWAVDEQENELGVRCIGAAIVSVTGATVGALSISGLAGRFSRDDCRAIAPAVTAAAAAIGASLY
jgi:DNA-binding IclR family transcriptional regulator